MAPALLPAAARKKLLQRAHRPGRVPRLQQPDRQRASYFRAIKAYMARCRALVLPAVEDLLSQLPVPTADARADAIDERRVRDLFSGLAKAIVERTPNAQLARAARAAAGEVDRFQRAQLRSAFISSLGVDLFDLFKTEPNLRPAVDAFTTENVSRIRSISDKYLGSVEKLVLEAVRAGVRAPRLAEDIARRGQVADSKAALIARDQLGKFYGSLNQVRQEALGLRRYRWRAVRDNRVREEHVDRDGTVFGWSSPPSATPDDGHPGTPINCRCWAEPMLEDVFRSLPG